MGNDKFDYKAVVYVFEALANAYALGQVDYLANIVSIKWLAHTYEIKFYTPSPFVWVCYEVDIRRYSGTEAQRAISLFHDALNFRDEHLLKLPASLWEWEYPTQNAERGETIDIGKPNNDR